MEFADGGEPRTKLEVTGPSPRGRTGTTVTFWPDAAIFDEVEFRAQTILERLQEYAFLNAGLEIRFTRRAARARATSRYVTSTPGGIIDFVRHLNASKEALFKKVGLLQGRPRTTARSRSPCSGTPATTRASTASPTASPPPRAARTWRASRRP